ncbi:hypothetical protein [Piscirickettsia salmonis]|uniref:hypothetical protein n=1 Tax=Piscirickettsia salmonis TaxID=1238 RepID=UPI0003169B49|nr:hypothetical protein [Piscirickettsia salmonis]ALA26703.1 fumarate reductase [Piscirickettsia salmonis]APS45830.1 hypothetical protein AVI48_15460 [Piscirickettsia salmonis]APS49206.1 hypothetical protein AVI49_16215 [Piscirickettsia salmonis]ERL60567.1 hypothetical protein K661_03112 [Piscirickettsia salmonis LF-89 = ATCC VR-1361]PEQ17001.1 hypothetical protein X973_04420 [Piscirickettsia salmonis]
MGNSLDELAKKVGVDLSEKKTPKKSTNRFVARRRRGWTEEDEDGIKQETIPSPDTNKSKDKLKKLATPKVGEAENIKTPSLAFKNLRGNPLSLIYYLHEKSSSKTFITEKITQRGVIESINISRESAKTALRFLLKNSLIVRVEFQPGRAGWSIYSIDKSLFQEISDRKPSNKP